MVLLVLCVVAVVMLVLLPTVSASVLLLFSVESTPTKGSRDSDPSIGVPGSAQALLPLAVAVGIVDVALAEPVEMLPFIRNILQLHGDLAAEATTSPPAAAFSAFTAPADAVEPDAFLSLTFPPYGISPSLAATELADGLVNFAGATPIDRAKTAAPAAAAATAAEAETAETASEPPPSGAVELTAPAPAPAEPAAAGCFPAASTAAAAVVASPMAAATSAASLLAASLLLSVRVTSAWSCAPPIVRSAADFLDRGEMVRVALMAAGAAVEAATVVVVVVVMVVNVGKVLIVSMLALLLLELLVLLMVLLRSLGSVLALVLVVAFLAVAGMLCLPSCALRPRVRTTDLFSRPPPPPPPPAAAADLTPTSPSNRLTLDPPPSSGID